MGDISENLAESGGGLIIVQNYRTLSLLHTTLSKCKLEIISRAGMCIFVKVLHITQPGLIS